MKFIFNEIMICIICGMEFNKTGNNQKCCSGECSKINKKEYRKTHEEYYQEYYKQWCQENKEKMEKYFKEYDKQRYKKNKKEILKRNKKYRQTPNGKESMKKHFNKRQRNLEFNPLNEYFEGSEAHHIDEINIIYIPKELHQSIYHSLFKNINMNEINLLTWNYLESNSY